MVTIKSNGRVEFRFFSRGARRVQVVGDFSGWLSQPIEMSPGADGWWRVTTAIDSGEFRFRYLIDGRHWMTDFAAFGVAPNGYGQFDSVLIVTESAVRDVQPVAAS